MSNKELKALAKEQINGNILMLFVIALIFVVINTVVVAIPVVGQVAIFFVSGILNISMCTIYLNLAKGQEPKVEDLQIGLKEWKEGTILFFFEGLFISIWTLLFIIPGIIKGIAYSQCFFILADNPGMSGRQALKESMKMMQGHKMDYFMLMLSFLGWNILAVCTCGILYLWLGPYMYAAATNFYNTIKGSVAYEA